MWQFYGGAQSGVGRHTTRSRRRPRWLGSSFACLIIVWPPLWIIDTILAADREAQGKQQRTAKQIFKRLRDEHGCGYAMMKDYVWLCRARWRETFVPLAHPPRHAQVDVGEAVAVVCRWRGADEDPLFLHVAAAVGCLLLQGLSAQDRGVSRRARVGIRVLHKRTAVHPLRQHDLRRGENLRRRNA